MYGCLTCGYIGCGRGVRGHSESHFSKSSHPLFIDINNGATYW